MIGAKCGSSPFILLQSMSTTAFRPPQFSDDVAWLPAWLQPNQSAIMSSQDHHNQNVGSLEGENCHVKELNLSTNCESRHKLCRLYLSGEDNSPITLTPSCEKTLHFNLHLSTIETSSIISSALCASQDGKKNPTSALVDSREKGLCYMGHDSSKLNIVPSPLIEKFSGCSDKQTPLSYSGGEKSLEISNHKCAECDDITDAVELSVAASEALVIHKASSSESLSDALSMSSILEVALRVKQARLNGKKESSCCFKKFGDTADLLTDLGDSDMEDAYNDVGLDVRSLDNILLQEPSASPSRVKETPLLELPGEDKEIQCRFQGDQEIDFDNNSATHFLENCSARNKSKDFPVKIFDDDELKILCSNPSVEWIFGNHLQNGSLGVLRTEQEGKIDITCVNGFPFQIGVHSSPQFQHSRKEVRLDCTSTSPANYAGMNEATGNASCRFRSRWLGGWTGMDAVKSNVKHKKTINCFIQETSYLSESVDIFPDQNSVVHNCHLSSNASISNKPFEDSYKAAIKEVFVSQEVKSSTSSVDPLCSVVPCSISGEIGDSILPAKINKDHQALDAFKILPIGREFPLEISQTRSGDKNDNAGREEDIEFHLDDDGPVIHQILTSLNSTGLPSFSLKKNLNSAIVSCCGETDTKVISDSIKLPINEAATDQPPVRSTNCPTAKSMQEDKQIKMRSVKQCPSGTNKSEKQVSDNQPPVKSVFSSNAATINRENHGDWAFGGLVQETYEKIDDRGTQQQVCFKDNPTSPLVLCHRKRRFKAPKLPVSDVATAKQLKDQGPAFEKRCYEIEKTSEVQFYNLLKTDLPARKRVHFSDDCKLQTRQDHVRKNLRRIPTSVYRSSCKFGTGPEICHWEQGTTSQEVKESLTKCRLKGRKRSIFQGLDFLLTGFSKIKEKEIEGLLRKYGGMVLSDIPALLPHPRRSKALKLDAEKLPVVLCTKKVQTTRFLYGCAVNAFLLKVRWVYDSIRVSSVLRPDKYLIFSHQINGKLNQIGKSICQIDNYDHIFEEIGIMLHGTHCFCTKLSKVIKYGRGRVYKSLQWLVQSLEKKKISLAVIVVEDEHRATRHLKKCASEQNITVMPARWIINSLYEAKLLPLMEKKRSSNPPVTSVSEVYNPQDWSQEI